MRALITGINGFVGGHLAECLVGHGWNVWGMARQQRLSLPHLQEQVHLLVGDAQHVDALAAVIDQARPDVIYHLAGQANVHRSFSEPEYTLQANMLPQLHLFQALIQRDHHPIVVIAGSNEIYGRIDPNDLPVDEDTSLRPVSPYAVSKAVQDMLAYQYHVTNKLRTVRMRPFNHIGPRQSEHFVSSAFAAQIARIEAGQQEPLLQVGNLAAERDFTDVRDMACAYMLAATDQAVGKAYNVGSGRSISIQHLLDTLLSLSTCPIEVRSDPQRMRPADVPYVVCDNRRFCQDTGWQPQIPIERTLHDILDYWRTQVRS